MKSWKRDDGGGSRSRRGHGQDLAILLECDEGDVGGEAWIGSPIRGRGELAQACAVGFGGGDLRGIIRRGEVALKCDGAAVGTDDGVLRIERVGRELSQIAKAGSIEIDDISILRYRREGGGWLRAFNTKRPLPPIARRGVPVT